MDASSEKKCCTTPNLIAKETRPNAARCGLPLYNGVFASRFLLAINSNNRVNEMLRKVRYWAGIPLVLITTAFIIHKIYINWTMIKVVISQIKVGAALMGMGILSIAITLLGWNWTSVLHCRGINTCRLNCIRTYFLANLIRYIPGGVWHFAGRTLWLSSQGYRLQSAIESLIFEQGLTLVAAIAVGSASLEITLRKPFTLGTTIFSVFLLGLLAAFVATVPKTSRKNLNLQFIERWLILVAGYILFWILYGLATCCFAIAIFDSERLTTYDCIRLIGQTALSWAVGYMIVVVPNGWGVRELAFAHLLSRDFAGNIVFILPVLSRLAQILAEILCGGIFSLLWQLSLRKEPGVS